MQDVIFAELIPENASQKLNSSNRKVLSALHPLGTHCAIAIGHQDLKQKTQIFPQDGQVGVVSFGGIPPERSQFCLQALERFEAVQTNANPTQKVGFTPILSESQRLLHISQQYRQDVRLYVEACRKRLDKLFHSKSTSTSIATLESEGFLFEGFHMVWHLAEVLYLDEDLADKLMDWLNTNFPSPTPEEFQTLIAYVNPTMHPKFWDLVYTCLLRGHLTATQELLERLGNDGSHPHIEPLVRALQDVLNSKPAREGEWKKWRDQCRYFANETLLQTMCKDQDLIPQFLTCFKILSGDADTIIQVANSWQERVVALVWFSKEEVDANVVTQVTQQLQNVNAIGEVRIIDTILLDLCLGNVQTAVQEASRLDWWLVSHLVDLLSRGVKHVKLQQRLASIRDWFVANYAQQLMVDETLWPIGLQYLTYCCEGRATASVLIPRLQPKTEDELHRIVLTCRYFGLRRELDILYTTLGTRSLAQGDPVAALSFFSKAKCSWRVAETVDRLLKDGIPVDPVVLDEARDNLGPGSASDRISMLSNFIKFQKGGNVDDLLTLLHDQETPVKHKRSLIEQACQWIESGTQVESRAILNMMKSLEECLLQSTDHQDVLPLRKTLVNALAHCQDFAL
jgi:hypothetical protein